MSDNPEARIRDRLAVLGIHPDPATLSRIVAFSATLPATAQVMAHAYPFAVEPVSGAIAGNPEATRDV